MGRGIWSKGLADQGPAQSRCSSTKGVAFSGRAVVNKEILRGPKPLAGDAGFFAKQTNQKAFQKYFRGRGKKPFFLRKIFFCFFFFFIFFFLESPGRGGPKEEFYLGDGFLRHPRE